VLWVAIGVELLEINLLNASATLHFLLGEFSREKADQKVDRAGSTDFPGAGLLPDSTALQATLSQAKGDNIHM